MRKMVNKVHLEGLLYDHKLQKRVTGENSKNPGTEYIAGSISIATDEDCLNIVDVHYTYTTEMTNKGTKNATYGILADIIDGNSATVMSAGKENALKVRVDTSFGLNEWYDPEDPSRLISVKRNEGGFIHTVTALKPDEKDRNYFETDILLTGTRTMEADPDKNLPEKLILKGAIFNFRNDLLPVEFSVINPNAISYFESLDISNSEPVVTKVKGRQISETVTRTITEEGAFGDSVREVTSSRKDCVITWAMREPFEWDDESSITAAELKECMAKRETELAAMKARTQENKKPASAAAAPAKGGFNF